MRIIMVGAVLLSLLLHGCQSDVFYHSEAELPPSGWLQSDDQMFSFVVDDTSARYDLTLYVEHQQSYEYQNLYLKLNTVFPDREAIEKVLSVDLADPQGRWYGDCGRSSCVAEVNLQRNAFFESLGEHQVSITHHMRIDTLRHITTISLQLQQASITSSPD